MGSLPQPPGCHRAVVETGPLYRENNSEIVAPFVPPSEAHNSNERTGISFSLFSLSKVLCHNLSLQLLLI